MNRKLERESERPAVWDEEDVLYVRNPDGSISIVKKDGDKDASDD